MGEDVDVGSIDDGIARGWTSDCTSRKYSSLIMIKNRIELTPRQITELGLIVDERIPVVA